MLLINVLIPIHQPPYLQNLDYFTEYGIMTIRFLVYLSRIRDSVNKAPETFFSTFILFYFCKICYSLWFFVNCKIESWILKLGFRGLNKLQEFKVSTILLCKFQIEIFLSTLIMTTKRALPDLHGFFGPQIKNQRKIVEKYKKVIQIGFKIF